LMKNFPLRLREGHLLLPPDSSSSASTNRGLHTNDHYLQIVHVVEPPQVTFEEPQPSLSANSRQNSVSHDENGA
jgi:hypothetical protein